MNIATGTSQVNWRKLTTDEQKQYGPGHMVVGFAERCPYCQAEDIAVVSDEGNPDSQNVYLENHYVPSEGRPLCRVSEAFLHHLNGWMQGEAENQITVHTVGMSYADFVAKRDHSTV